MLTLPQRAAAEQVEQAEERCSRRMRPRAGVGSTPGIGMCATKRKMTSIAAVKSSFLRMSGCCTASKTAWSSRGRLLACCRLAASAMLRLRRLFLRRFLRVATSPACRRRQPRPSRLLAGGGDLLAALRTRTEFGLRSAGFGSGTPFSQRTLPPAASIFATRGLREARRFDGQRDGDIASPSIFTGLPVRTRRARRQRLGVDFGAGREAIDSMPTFTSS